MSVQWWPKYTLLVGLTGRETGIMDHSSRFQGAARSLRQVAAPGRPKCQACAVEAELQQLGECLEDLIREVQHQGAALAAEVTPVATR